MSVSGISRLGRCLHYYYDIIIKVCNWDFVWLMLYHFLFSVCVHKLRGHTSTVRCLKMVDETTAISGSRDATLRIWDISTGVCKNVLAGHQASVRCLDVHGDLVVSGSYDTTAKIWSISEARCLRTLTGHFSQIYAVAFDGKRIATGSLDTSVRIWSPHSSQCYAVLQGHTSLVGQLQLRGDTLVTGGSDGSIRVWSLERRGPIHRLAAHDNSITSLQFNHNRIVSGGSDGRVKIWDLQAGQLVRELGQPADSVWRIAFQEERAVVMATRLGRIVMEVSRLFDTYCLLIVFLSTFFVFLSFRPVTDMFLGTRSGTFLPLPTAISPEMLPRLLPRHPRHPRILSILLTITLKPAWPSLALKYRTWTCRMCLRSLESSCCQSVPLGWRRWRHVPNSVSLLACIGVDKHFLDFWVCICHSGFGRRSGEQGLSLRSIPFHS